MLNFRICIKITSKKDIYFSSSLQVIFSTSCCKCLSKGFWIDEDILSCFYFFDLFIQWMDKMQVEEMHSIFAQKITYEEKSAILQNVQNDSVGIKVNFCGRQLFQLYFNFETILLSASSINLKFPLLSGKSDVRKSCVMNTVSGTSCKKKTKLISITE